MAIRQRLSIRAVERWLDRALERPGQRAFVIIVIAAIGLTAVWTGADDYRAALSRRGILEQQLNDAEIARASLPQIKSQFEEARQTLTELRAQLVPTDEGHIFREKVIELARSAGCEVRRIHLAQGPSRPWRPEMNPLTDAVSVRAAAASPFQLERQVLSLTVIGSLAGIVDLLDEMEATGKIAHTKRLTLKPDQTDRDVVTLDLELLLFNLEATESVTAG